MSYGEGDETEAEKTNSSHATGWQVAPQRSLPQTPQLRSRWNHAVKPEPVRNVLIVIYMVGNALTFNIVFKMERAAMALHDSASPALLEALALALIWPVYWLWRIVS